MQDWYSLKFKVLIKVVPRFPRFHLWITGQRLMEDHYKPLIYIRKGSLVPKKCSAIFMVTQRIINDPSAMSLSYSVISVGPTWYLSDLSRSHSVLLSQNERSANFAWSWRQDRSKISIDRHESWRKLHIWSHNGRTLISQTFTQKQPFRGFEKSMGDRTNFGSLNGRLSISVCVKGVLGELIHFQGRKFCQINLAPFWNGSTLNGKNLYTLSF